MSAEQAKSAAAAPTEVKEADFLEQVLTATEAQPGQRESVKDAVKGFISVLLKHHPGTDRRSKNFLNNMIAELDRQVSAQLNEVLHHEVFQRLEGTWRGLHYLVSNTITSPELKIKVLNVKKDELLADMDEHDYDQSELWKRVYSDQYDMLGGKPYGLLMGNYDFSYHSQDVSLLRRFATVAAAAHAPFVAAANPQMFKLKRFDRLQDPAKLANIFESTDHTGWRSFRDSEDSRYVGLTLPRVLARLPYGKDFKPIKEFDFEEHVDGRDHDKYLWMNAAWAYAARVTNAFFKDGWLARIRGVKGGGRVEDLPVHTFKTDDGDKDMKCPTEIAIPGRREAELSNLGFLPLLHHKDSDFAVFMGAQSCQKPKKYGGQYGDQATANAELSARFNYLMCVARFSHLLNVLARQWIGSFMSAPECEKKLNEWISDYVLGNPEGQTDELKARKPLQKAEIRVTANPRRPGWYEAQAFLLPHLQLEGLTAAMCLVAEIPPPKK